ncbi:MAG: WD_0033/WD_0034 family tandem repeat-containing protein [Wolbachia sp.]
MKMPKLTGKVVCDIYELTDKDRKNIQKLAREIEEGKGIARKFRNGIFKKSSYNASTILLAKIIYKYQGREETLSLLHYAISHKNNQAVKDLLEEAKKQKLLKEVLNEEMTTKHSDGREETHTILTDAISRRDNDIMRVVLKISEENGILKDILKKRIIIKHSNGKETTYTPFTYAEACENSEAVRELGNILNKRATQQSTVVTAKTTTARSEKVLQDNIVVPVDTYENSNESSLEESIEHKPCENSNAIAIEDKDIAASIEKLDNTGICEKNETAVTETDIQEQNASNSLSSAACFDNGSSKENTADKKRKTINATKTSNLGW